MFPAPERPECMSRRVYIYIYMYIYIYICIYTYGHICVCEYVSSTYVFHMSSVCEVQLVANCICEGSQRPVRVPNIANSLCKLATKMLTTLGMGLQQTDAFCRPLFGRTKTPKTLKSCNGSERYIYIYILWEGTSKMFFPLVGTPCHVPC